MNFLEKLDFLISRKGINKNVLSIESGIPYTTIDGFYKKGYKNAKLPTIQKLADYFDTTLDYLIRDEVTDVNFGKAAGFQVDYLEMEHIKKYRQIDAFGKEAVEAVLNAEYRRVEAIRAPKEQEKESDIIKFPKREAPLYDIRVSAGTGQFLDSSSYTMIIMEEDEPPETSFLVTVTGDSMEPTYYSGDTLYIKQQPEIKVGEIGLFMINGNVFVKELAEEGLKSHNPKYPEIYFHDTDAIHCYGKVLGVREGKSTTDV